MMTKRKRAATILVFAICLAPIPVGIVFLTEFPQPEIFTHIFAESTEPETSPLDDPAFDELERLIAEPETPAPGRREGRPAALDDPLDDPAFDELDRLIEKAEGTLARSSREDSLAELDRLIAETERSIEAAELTLDDPIFDEARRLIAELEAATSLSLDDFDGPDYFDVDRDELAQILAEQSAKAEAAVASSRLDDPLLWDELDRLIAENEARRLLEDEAGMVLTDYAELVAGYLEPVAFVLATVLVLGGWLWGLLFLVFFWIPLGLLIDWLASRRGRLSPAPESRS